MKFKCIKSDGFYFTNGSIYEVTKNNGVYKCYDYNCYVIIDDNNETWGEWSRIENKSTKKLLDAFNEYWHTDGYVFELVEGLENDFAVTTDSSTVKSKNFKVF